MVIKTKFPLLLFFLLFLTLTYSSLAKYEPTRRDPQTQKEYEECQRSCEQQERGHQQQCVARCEEKLREQEREDERRRHAGGGGGGLYNVADPQKEYQQCQSRCQQQERGSQHQQQQCQQRCEEKLREQEREEQRGGGGGTDDALFNADPQKEYQQCQSRCQRKAEPRKQQKCQQRCEEKRREQERESEQGGNPRSTEEAEENNPYYYTKKHFHARVRTSEGHVSVLEKFSKRSDQLLKGIENYRIGILEANPSTFIVPHHIDADAVLSVVRGKGSISLVSQNNRETHNLEQGDVMTVSAGTVVYLINRDNNEKLVIAKLLQSISTPGRVEAFFGAGGEDPESFYNSFSKEVLEAAFNIPREKLQRLIGQQKKGAIIKASHEQIKALSPRTHWPFGSGESGGPYNLLHHRPLHSNNYGQLFQVTPNDYKQLRLMDVVVAFANISRGAMLGPSYNTRATKIAVVVEGNGYYEMPCPHVSSAPGGRHQGGGAGGSLQHHEGSSSSSSGGHYQKMSAKLSRGDVIVVPAGHPVVIVASRDQNLQVVCFDLNARDNEMNSLAGRENVLKHIEREAKELAFGDVPVGEVEEMLNKQQESFFFPGPRQQQEEQGRAYA